MADRRPHHRLVLAGLESPTDTEMKKPIEDEFKGGNAHLCESIKALIKMNDDGILVPHGIGGHARAMLASCYHRLGGEPEALGMVAGERARQIHRGFTADHDDAHTNREIANAALCYLKHYVERAWTIDNEMGLSVEPGTYQNAESPWEWPWEEEAWNPKGKIEDLTRVAALVVAEIERLERLSENWGSCQPSPPP